jgi:hypothetical protein
LAATTHWVPSGILYELLKWQGKQGLRDTGYEGTRNSQNGKENGDYISLLVWQLWNRQHLHLLLDNALVHLEVHLSRF